MTASRSHSEHPRDSLGRFPASSAGVASGERTDPALDREPEVADVKAVPLPGATPFRLVEDVASDEPAEGARRRAVQRVRRNPPLLGPEKAFDRAGRRPEAELA